jgi:hypothetical protein
MSNTSKVTILATGKTGARPAGKASKAPTPSSRSQRPMCRASSASQVMNIGDRAAFM